MPTFATHKKESSKPQVRPHKFLHEKTLKNTKTLTSQQTRQTYNEITGDCVNVGQLVKERISHAEINKTI